MYPNPLPIFKELTPYSGESDENNRWIKLAKWAPWDQLDIIYREYVDKSKQRDIKKRRFILGLMLGQM